MTFDLFKAFVLGVVEGLTEFCRCPRRHLLLVQQFFGFDDDDFGKTFAVLIQFGAILALLSIYSFRIWQLALGMFKDPAAQRFIIGVLIAFLPAALVGAFAHDCIKAVLFNVWIVCFTLIVGGAILLWVDQMDLDTRYHDATKFSLRCSKHRPGVRVHDSGFALGRHHRPPCCWAPTGAGGGVLVLARDADDAGALPTISREPRADERDN